MKAKFIIMCITVIARQSSDIFGTQFITIRYSYVCVSVTARKKTYFSWTI